MTKKIHLLASTDAIESIRQRHPQIFADHVGSVLPFVFGESPDPAELARVNVALLSRDITGTSTKHVVQPPLAQYSEWMLTAPNLRWVHTHAAGTDRPIYGALRERDVVLTTSTGANSTIVAQSVLGAVLALNRRFPILGEAQRKREWRSLIGELMPRDLAGQKAVVVGWGPIGQKIAAFLQMLEIEVTAVRRDPAGRADEARDSEITMISYEDFKKNEVRYDWIVLACPLTETTYRLLDRDFISGLSQRAHILNVSRGDVVEEQALIEALRDGKIGGAYLDVFAHEPLGSDSELWGLPNTMVSPHSAAHSSGNYGRSLGIFAKNMERWGKGEELVNLAF